MIDQEVLSLQTGTLIRETFNGRSSLYRIVRVKSIGKCINPNSKAFGHAWAYISCYWGSMGSTMDFSIHSDEYSNAQGYPVCDQTGRRLRGYAVVTNDEKQHDPLVIEFLQKEHAQAGTNWEAN